MFVTKYEGNKPVKKKVDDAGFDLISSQDLIIPSFQSRLIKTGTKIQLPRMHVGLIWSRSGLSVKHKLEVGAGCIDENYRGEICVHLYNYSEVDYTVCEGDRIAQLLVIPLGDVRMVKGDLGDSSRGENGFGSSGVQ